MELIIEEKLFTHEYENEPQGLNPFKDFKLPTFTKKIPQQQQQQQQHQQPQPQIHNKYHPREPFKQPSYHQKYQKTYKIQSQPPPQPQKPSNFSYDHILNSLNMKVTDGKLEYLTNTSSLEKSKNKIINHYFQNQSNPTQIHNPPQNENISITKEEHQKRVIYYYWQQQKARKRIAQIKSKKMLYPTNNIQISKTKFKSLSFG